MASKEIVYNAVKTLQSEGLLGKTRVDSGDNLTMSCPFVANHGGRREQRTPSFGIHKTSGKWNCFSCGERGGSVYTLFARLKGVSQDDATYTLGTPKVTVNLVEDALKDLGAEERPYCMTALPKVVPIARDPTALAYMVGRGIPESLLTKCGVGYYGGVRMPDKLDGVPSGVLGKRVMFDILYEGQSVGYSARTMGEDNPKYYRPVKNVNLTLYDPLDVLHSGMAYVVVCEGEISCLAALREGLPAVCSFGASISQQQMALLNRFQAVVSLFDADSAGEKGVRGMVDGYASYARIRPILLPDGQDPASMKPGWGERLKKQIQRARESDTLDAINKLLAGL